MSVYLQAISTEKLTRELLARVRAQGINPDNTRVLLAASLALLLEVGKQKLAVMELAIEVAKLHKENRNVNQDGERDAAQPSAGERSGEDGNGTAGQPVGAGNHGEVPPQGDAATGAGGDGQAGA